ELRIAPDDRYAIIVLAGIRFFIASLLIFALIIIGIRKSPKVKIVMLPQLLLLGLLQISLMYFFFYNGLAHTSGMKGAILSSAGIFFVVVLAHFVYVNDRLDWRKILGLIAGFSGIILINSGKNFTFDFSWQGEGFMILSGLVSSLGTILAKRISKEVHPFILTAWQMLLGSLLLIAVGLPSLKPHAMVFTNKALLLLFYSAFLSATAFSLWYAILKYNKAGEISIFKFMTPVSGTMLSALFIPGERVTLNMFVVLALVALGVIIVNYQSKIPKEAFLREGPY
ncbi:MAG TPA: DMT family transporter, partial [Desulfosporosinus sp.]|nr:DMT family transporter [Desulfosporosinus sp.]